MTEHEHSWTPIPLRCGRYACACGVEGYRARDRIRVSKRPGRAHTSLTARSRTFGDGGAVPALPTLDRQERT